jgi:quercetin dioxygenase-like cupin family protein
LQTFALPPNRERPKIRVEESLAVPDPGTEREGGMLTRREFAGIASCAICGITAFATAQASAQGAPPAATGGVTRKILSQLDGPAPGYVTLLVEATIEAGVAVGRHTHPGIESAYVLEGGFELPIQGQPTRTIKAGDAFQVPPATPHAGGKAGAAKSRILITYVVEKGKPLASPA